jgi:hypothetical protein
MCCQIYFHNIRYEITGKCLEKFIQTFGPEVPKSQSLQLNTIKFSSDLDLSKPFGRHFQMSYHEKSRLISHVSSRE